MKIAKGTVSWILFPFSLAILFLWLYTINSDYISKIFLLLSIFLFLLTLFFILFFRDPTRDIGKGVVSPADGRIQNIIQNKDNDIGKCVIISIFMNVYNVHVNRMPIDGLINDIIHIPGSHLPAFKKESERNERVIIKVDTKIGIIKVIQIAGTLARRIVPYVKKGDKLKKGERIGLIRLGSRVDIYIPSYKIKKINVSKGEKIKAGEISIAEIND